MVYLWFCSLLELKIRWGGGNDSRRILLIFCIKTYIVTSLELPKWGWHGEELQLRFYSLSHNQVLITVNSLCLKRKQYLSRQENKLYLRSYKADFNVVQKKKHPLLISGSLTSYLFFNIISCFTRMKQCWESSDQLAISCRLMYVFSGWYL